jgi:hypothetical protein
MQTVVLVFSGVLIAVKITATKEKPAEQIPKIFIH